MHDFYLRSAAQSIEPISCASSVKSACYCTLTCATVQHPIQQQPCHMGRQSLTWSVLRLCARGILPATAATITARTVLAMRVTQHWRFACLLAECSVACTTAMIPLPMGHSIAGAAAAQHSTFDGTSTEAVPSVRSNEQCFCHVAAPHRSVGRLTRRVPEIDSSTKC